MGLNTENLPAETSGETQRLPLRPYFFPDCKPILDLPREEH